MNTSIILKTRDEREKISNTCKAIRAVFKGLESSIKPGVSPVQIEALSQSLLKEQGLESLSCLKGKSYGCLVSVNHVAAHGIPQKTLLKDSDLLTIDISAKKEGWAGDMAYTYCLGEGSLEDRRLVDVAKMISHEIVSNMQAGIMLSSMIDKLQKTVEDKGVFLFPELVGHGLGQNLHEDPIVYYSREYFKDYPLVPGMILTAEPVIAYSPDTLIFDAQTGEIYTKSGQKTAQFELSFAITSQGSFIL